MNKVIVAGSRDFKDYSHLEMELTYQLGTMADVEIVSGGAKGTDLMGEHYAQENNIPIKQFPADWKTHKKAAGPIRNEQMAQYADLCILFWNGKTKGSANMKKNCIKYKVPLIEIIVNL